MAHHLNKLCANFACGIFSIQISSLVDKIKNQVTLKREKILEIISEDVKK